MLLEVKRELSRDDDSSSDDDISLKFHRKLEQKKRSLEAEINMTVVSRKKVCHGISKSISLNDLVLQDDRNTKASKSKDNIQKGIGVSRNNDEDGKRQRDKLRIPVSTSESVLHNTTTKEPVSIYKNLQQGSANEKSKILRRFLYIPTERYGEFIGKKGYNINSVKRYTGATLDAKKCPERSEVYVEGFQSNVEKAVQIVNAFCSSEKSFDHPWLDKILRTIASSEDSTPTNKDNSSILTEAKKCPRTGQLLKIEYIPTERVPEFVGRKSCNLGLIEKKVAVKLFVPKLTNTTSRTITEKREIQILGDASAIKIVQKLIEYFRLLERKVDRKRPWARDALKMLKEEETAKKANEIISTNPTTKAVTVLETGTSNSTSKVTENDEVIYVRSESKDNAISITSKPDKQETGNVLYDIPNTESLKRKLSSSTPENEIGQSNALLLEFLQAQQGCFKCSVQEFFMWLRSEDVLSIVDLAEAFADEEYVQSEMKANGLKGYKSGIVRKACAAKLQELEID